LERGRDGSGTWHTDGGISSVFIEFTLRHGHSLNMQVGRNILKKKCVKKKERREDKGEIDACRYLSAL
jgi:hypothetical protein